MQSSYFAIAVLGSALATSPYAFGAGCAPYGPGNRLESVSPEYASAAARVQKASTALIQRMDDLPNEAIRARFSAETDHEAKLLKLPDTTYREWRGVESELRLVCAKNREAQVDAALKDPKLLAQELGQLQSLAAATEAKVRAPRETYVSEYTRETDRVRKEANSLETSLARMKQDLAAAKRAQQTAK